MKFQGWGTSLAWWANINYPSNVREWLNTMLYDSQTGLGINIVRYNIGGGTNPDNPQTTLRRGALMPCLQPNKGDQIDFNNDKFQIQALEDSLKYGVKHVEIFSNSPPWWMTHSGKTSGASTVGKNNLKYNSEQDYINFLIDVTERLQKKYNITVHVSPFNEPTNIFWMESGNQEGCFWDPLVRWRIIRGLKAAKRDILISAAEESYSLLALLWHIIAPHKHIDRVNLHGYNSKSFTETNFYIDDLDIWRYGLRYLTDKPIWLSEYGMGGADTIENALKLGAQIFRDLQTLQPTAWVYWQVVEDRSGNRWGLIQIDFENPQLDNVVIHKQYWVMKHFTRTLLEGDTYTVVNKNVLKIDNTNEIGFVVLNDSPNVLNLTLDIPGNYRIVRASITNKLQDFEELQQIPSMFPEYSITSVRLELLNI
jgi:O-glycosyl hydrolase